MNSDEITEIGNIILFRVYLSQNSLLLLEYAGIKYT